MRRLATLAVLGMLGTALLVSGALAQQNASLGVEGKTDYNRQFTKVGGIYVNGSGDTIMVRGRFTDAGIQQVELSNGPETQSQWLTLGIDNLTFTAGRAYRSPTAVDVSRFRRAKLFLLWNVSAAADSDSVRIAVRVFGKTTSSFALGDDAQLQLERVKWSALADTVRIPDGRAVGKTTPPTAVVAGPVSFTGSGLCAISVDGTLRATATSSWASRLVWPSAGAAVVDLGEINLPYLYTSIANWSGGNLTGLTALLWVSQ